MTGGINCKPKWYLLCIIDQVVSWEIIRFCKTCELWILDILACCQGPAATTGYDLRSLSGWTGPLPLVGNAWRMIFADLDMDSLAHYWNLIFSFSNRQPIISHLFPFSAALECALKEREQHQRVCLILARNIRDWKTFGHYIYSKNSKCNFLLLVLRVTFS